MLEKMKIILEFLDMDVTLLNTFSRLCNKNDFSLDFPKIKIILY